MPGKKKIPVPTIGEILREEFLELLGISANRLAKEINVSTTTILELLNGNRKLLLIQPCVWLNFLEILKNSG